MLLAHDQPARALRLAERLNTMFDAPPIAWHHDVGQSPLEVPSDWRNVTLVTPHVSTKWGTFSLVEAIVRALGTLHGGHNRPAWSVVLSGADYPIKPANCVLGDLTASDCDGYIEHVEVKPSAWATEFEEDCFRRYHTVSVGVGARRWRTRGALARRVLSPFSDDFKCYAGSCWFCLGRAAVDAILAFHASDRRLARHLQHARIPEECYFNTVLGNAKGLRLRPHNLHYIDWADEEAAHPRMLDLGDLDALRQTPAHFARKLDLETCPELYDELDRLTV